jgi:hypothetical protein
LEGVRSEKLCHKNAITRKKSDPPRFSDNSKYPSFERIWPKPLCFQLLCIQLTVGFSDEGGDIAGQDEADLGDQVTRVDEPGDKRKG